MAVRNPCGLKNPVIQNTFGRSVVIQVLNCVFLSKSSVYQNPSVVDSHEICNLFIFSFQLLRRQTMNSYFNRRSVTTGSTLGQWRRSRSRDGWELLIRLCNQINGNYEEIARQTSELRLRRCIQLADCLTLIHRSGILASYIESKDSRNA